MLRIFIICNPSKIINHFIRRPDLVYPIYVYAAFIFEHQKTRQIISAGSFSQGYQDSNLEMTESESVALPFGDSPKRIPGRFSSFPFALDNYTKKPGKMQALFLLFPTFPNFFALPLGGLPAFYKEPRRSVPPAADGYPIFPDR